MGSVVYMNTYILLVYKLTYCGNPWVLLHNSEKAFEFQNVNVV